MNSVLNTVLCDVLANLLCVFIFVDDAGFHCGRVLMKVKQDTVWITTGLVKCTIGACFIGTVKFQSIFCIDMWSPIPGKEGAQWRTGDHVAI